jgi:hypothetical protein
VSLTSTAAAHPLSLSFLICGVFVAPSFLPCFLVQTHILYAELSLTPLSILYFSFSGVVQAVVPGNDVCTSATTYLVNGPAEGGTNVEATNENRCSVATDQAAGVWFEFQGTGNIMTASTCGTATNFASQVDVGDADACGGTCVANDNGGLVVDCKNANGQTLTFDSESDVLYHAMVSGRNLGDEGVFDFSVVDYKAPSNDDCDNAHPLFDNLANEVSGSTVNATKDERCGSNTLGRGVWYAFMGTGKTMTVTTCSDRTDFSNNLRVTEGCGETVCLADDNPDFAPFCENNAFGETFTFESVPGQAYRALVEGKTSTNTVGAFALSVFDYTPPTNDECSQSIALKINAPVVLGNSNNSTKDDHADCDGTVLGRGVWYAFAGNGKTMTVSTCHEAITEVSTELVVTAGCTTSGTCIATEDPGFAVPCINPFGETVTFDTEVGRSYRVLVKGPTAKVTGKFGITVSDYLAPENDSCSKPILLAPNAEAATVGTTVNATKETFCDDSLNVGRGVWYAFAGTGDTMTVSTCEAETDFFTDVKVHTGCGGTCIDNIYPGFDVPCPNPFGKTVTIDTVAGTTYRVFVQGDNTANVGKFGISLRQYSPPENDDCTNAKSLTVNGDSDNHGDTRKASAEATCSSNGDLRRGVWYAVAGNGMHVSVTTCHPSTDFKVDIDIYQNCNSNICLGMDSGVVQMDGCPGNALATEVTWPTFKGYSYYIFVSGIVTTLVGNFGIRAFDSDSFPSPQPSAVPTFTPEPTAAPSTAPSGDLGPRACEAKWACQTIFDNYNEKNGAWIFLELPFTGICLERCSVARPTLRYECGRCSEAKVSEAAVAPVATPESTSPPTSDVNTNECTPGDACTNAAGQKGITIHKATGPLCFLEMCALAHDLRVQQALGWTCGPCPE